MQDYLITACTKDLVQMTLMVENHSLRASILLFIECVDEIRTLTVGKLTSIRIRLR